MNTLVTLSWVLMIPGWADMQGHPPTDNLEHWNRFRLLAAPSEDTRELHQKLVNYVKSLTPEELLTTAREGCVAGTNKPGLRLDWERQAAAESNALLCLEIYYDINGPGEDGRRRLNTLTDALIAIAGDKEESVCLRRAIMVRMFDTPKSWFQHMLHTYVDAHRLEVRTMLEKTLTDQGENVALRKQAAENLTRQLAKESSKIINADPNVREALEEKRRHTNHVLCPSELVRSGEVTLTEETMKALAPVEARTIAYVKLLGAIVADERNEPEDLRKNAKRRLEGYRKSALTGIDVEVEKALRGGSE